ncbi:uncharacterized protein LOC123398731 isoform X3 [Hordeum vulgare subsp. vulgare]|uniref:uncharacterized protein LOC123398731 isoform X3 n=1 Tax=Hordeum vulgare subsp. vulgare TaxID=112509 RepID=UPI001D1A519D|nr:uncharacterized protein LOC123398731 isoform X3 [Hordeum vulgare subsp. vulgare]
MTGVAAKNRSGTTLCTSRPEKGIMVLKRDIPWETYMSTKLITSTCLQLLRRYDHKPESQRGPLLDEEDDDAAINVSMIESRASQLQSFALNDFVAYA